MLKHLEKKYGFRVRVIVKVTPKDSRVLNWIVKDQKLVREVLHNVSPYLQVVAQLADALSRLNVRSENRRKNTAVTVQEGCLP